MPQAVRKLAKEEAVNKPEPEPTTGYDLVYTPWWLCTRPECLVVLKLSGQLNEYKTSNPVSLWPVSIRSSACRCVICDRPLGKKEGLK